MLAAENGHSDIVKVLLEAGASTEAKNIVSKRISICTCVFHYCDDFNSMNNVIVIVLIMIISLLVLSLANMKMNILEIPHFNFS